jgi:sulfur-oxidizing protein SoxY
MSTMHRRTFLKGTLGAATLTVAAAAGLLAPARVLAAAWPKSAFEAKSMDDVAKALYGNAAGATSADIAIKAPIQAENGAVVPISVSTKLPKVDSIAILVKENPSPLVTSVELSGADGYYSARMKMGKTSDVKVYVRSDGKLYTATQQIKVTVGGCGG